MLVGDRQFSAANICGCKSRATNSFPKSGARATQSEIDLRSACSPPFAVPGIGESAGGEAAQCFDPLTTRGFTRVARGRYPIWGCSGLQQHTRLPTQSRACRERGYTIDSCKDYRVESYPPWVLRSGTPPGCTPLNKKVIFSIANAVYWSQNRMDRVRNQI